MEQFKDQREGEEKYATLSKGTKKRIPVDTRKEIVLGKRGVVANFVVRRPTIDVTSVWGKK